MCVCSIIYHGKKDTFMKWTILHLVVSLWDPRLKEDSWCILLLHWVRSQLSCDSLVALSQEKICLKLSGKLVPLTFVAPHHGRKCEQSDLLTYLPNDRFNKEDPLSLWQRCNLQIGLSASTKGQLISKGLFKVFICTKKQYKKRSNQKSSVRESK